MDVVRVGVIGLGSMGQRHLETLTRTTGAQVVAVATRNAEKRAAAKERFGVTTSADYRNLAGSVDAVIVAVPTVLHAEVAAFFLQSGAHVLVEKPIAATVAAAQQLNDLAAQTGKVLMVGHIERFNPAYQCFRQVFQTVVGKSSVTLLAHRMGPYDGRIQDVGVELDLLIHDVDAVAGLFPGCSLQLQKALGMPVITQFLDTALAQFVIVRGGESIGSATLFASRMADAKRRALQAQVADTTYTLDFMNQTVAMRHGATEQAVPVEKAFPLNGELQHFIDCVRYGLSPEVDAQAGLQALALCTQVGEQAQI